MPPCSLLIAKSAQSAPTTPPTSCKRSLSPSPRRSRPLTTIRKKDDSRLGSSRFYATPSAGHFRKQKRLPSTAGDSFSLEQLEITPSPEEEKDWNQDYQIQLLHCEVPPQTSSIFNKLLAPFGGTTSDQMTYKNKGWNCCSLTRRRSVLSHSIHTFHPEVRRSWTDKLLRSPLAP